MPQSNSLNTYYCTTCLWTRNQRLASMTAKSPTGTWHHLCPEHFSMYGGKYTHAYPCRFNTSLAPKLPLHTGQEQA